MKTWDIQQSRELHNISHWSDGYYDISDRGDVVVCPKKNIRHNCISLSNICRDVRKNGVKLPMLLRFPGILKDRVEMLCSAFDNAIKSESYTGKYTPVYPIKVNQRNRVVRELTGNGAGRIGLESGSKPEVMAVLGVNMPTNSVVVCNGYKDRNYIRAALIGQKMGRKVYIVIEKMSEVSLVLEEADKMDMTPCIGVRVRLAIVGKGKWQDSGGEKSKFGLSSSQVLLLIETLKKVNKLESLQMLHCHLGSQIANIQDIKAGLTEFARYFAQLHKLDVPLSCVDVGGGLAVDYDGTQTRSYSSMNYSSQEYANMIVNTFAESCRENNLEHPDIMSESGRALTAHHAVLILNISNVEKAPGKVSPGPADDKDPPVIKKLWNIFDRITSRSIVESYHDASQHITDAQSSFVSGLINLEQRARAEEIYHSICRQILTMLNPTAKPHREIQSDLNKKFADKYICNFSLFRSLSDSWGIGQLFPIMPLQRLNEKPTDRAVLQDITCDSDGRIDRYIQGDDIESNLALPPYREGEECLLGVFMVGAYQEILGNLHNLLGEVNSANVSINRDGTYTIDDIKKGDSVTDVLNRVHYDANSLIKTYQKQLENSNLSDARQDRLLSVLKDELEAHTYLS
ncbi:MAG: biosynthetic arginine decarboxylase [Desulfobacterales bacterium]|nr:biosynthetic arginine decarboxylase [Desulfobacterales bacterium]